MTSTTCSTPTTLDLADHRDLFRGEAEYRKFVTLLTSGGALRVCDKAKLLGTLQPLADGFFDEHNMQAYLDDPRLLDELLEGLDSNDFVD